VSTSRRQFFVSSVTAAAAAAQTAAPEIRTAMVGVGVRGTSLLRQTLALANVRVEAICDTDAGARDRAQGLAKRDNPRSFTDYRQVLDLGNIDAVYIATPCDLHAEMAAAALSAGKYVYCEKPLGITPEQVDLVLKAAAKSSAFLQVGQQLRYRTAFREVIRRIHEDRVLGETFVIKAQRHGTPSPGPRNRPAWYEDVRRSCDLIVENSVHNIDVCNWVANSRPASAYGHGKRYFPKPIPAGTLMMDGYSVEYIYENGVHLDYSQLGMHPRGLKKLPNGQWYLVFGETGTVDVAEGMFYPMQESGEPRDLLTPSTRISDDPAVPEFIACIREKRKPFGDVKVGAMAALTAILGREAIYKGRSVSWNELGVAL
jgi:myo-inositol 2-dehydrogenase / D-chiro-inositol 1-dehydrogenase